MLYRVEKRNARDLNISHRNGTYGVPTYDIDHVYFDDLTDEPFLRTTWKHGNQRSYDTNSVENVRLTKHANRAGLPFMLVFYYFLDKNDEIVHDHQPYSDVLHAQYYVAPLNDECKKYLPKQKRLTEVEFVKLINSMNIYCKNIHIPNGLSSTIKDPKCDNNLIYNPTIM